MKIIYSILVWSLGGVLFALILLIGISISYLLPPSKLNRAVQWMFRFWLHVFFIRVKVEGLENIVKERVYIFMANHTSIFDLPVLLAYIPQYSRGIEAHHQFRWPLWGWAIKRYGNIPIQRESAQSSLQTFRYAVSVLKGGTSVTILPEGHMTPDGSIKSFKSLPFLLAKESGAAIAPIGLSGLFKVKRKGSWLIQPARVRIKFGEVITSSQIEAMDPKSVSNLTRERILTLVQG
jgi:1-acyl-sn-glycerol-3-phosphate acyltransferase